MTEKWKDVGGYEGFYQVSSLGKIKSIERMGVGIDGRKYGVSERIRKQVKNGRGYLVVVLFAKNKKAIKYIHRLVASAFLDNPDNKPQVNHIDGNKTNNNVDNLEWNTHLENIRHAYDNNLMNPAKGEKHGRSKLSKEDIVWIRNNYIPSDRTFGCRAMGRKFRVSHRAVWAIINNRTWKE